MSASDGHETLPVLPLRDAVLFPMMWIPITVGRPSTVQAIENALSREDKTLVVFAQRDPTVEDPTAETLRPVGTRAVIKKMNRRETGFNLILQGLERIRLHAFTSTEPFLVAEIEPFPYPDESGSTIEALVRTVKDKMERMHELSEPPLTLVLAELQSSIDDPVQLAYMLGSVLNLTAEEAQAFLETESRSELLTKLNEHLDHEIQVLELKKEIAGKASSEIDKRQRDFMLREQLKAIREELGEGEDEEPEIGELREQLAEADLPESVREEAERELGRLARMNPASPEYQVVRSYLDLVIELPWKRHTEDTLDLDLAREILDEDHYGLDDVKERILEHLATLKLNPEANAPILCFVGPPGTGKTSLGQSIARAMGRKFERLALGGLHDESELRGHRRTYVGAMPGRIIQAIRRAGVANPLLMLDEVDKLGRDFRGDPSAALMEILDPAQNGRFLDNYLNLPFDLSKVFFITTANYLEGIPGPLLDRMEELTLAGYTDQEKIQIARRYLLPRRSGEAGLDAASVTIPDETLARIIRRYTRESGLRQLERALGGICRKIAFRFARGDTAAVRVEPGDLEDLLGVERFHEEAMRKNPPPGVAAGLAWTPAGGEVLYVEAVLLPHTNEFTLTGHLGEVMKESAKAAQSCIRSRSDVLGISDEHLQGRGVHVHVPSGAIPKDGPSAGITMATALASVHTNLPVRSDTAMTGEITLTGLVLPVGGIKQKVLAAHRAGMKRVILPEQNRPNLKDVPASVKQAIEFVFVERIEAVLAAAIPGLDARIEVGAREGSEDVSF